MSTRAVYGFRIDGEEKLTYNHSDGYPDYLGRHILTWAQQTGVARMREIARGLERVAKDSTPTPEQIAACRRWLNREVSTGSEQEWYSLLREAQGCPEAWEQGLRYFIDGRTELHADDTWCEWGYVLDLDLEILEVYSRKPYAYWDDDTHRYGLRRLLFVPLNDLPDEERFVLRCDELDHAAWAALQADLDR